jgi:hypothetical protein
LNFVTYTFFSNVQQVLIGISVHSQKLSIFQDLILGGLEVFLLHVANAGCNTLHFFALKFVAFSFISRCLAVVFLSVFGH